MSLRARRISRNLMALTIAQVASRAFAVVSTIYLARVLGADNFGVIVFATSVISYAALVVDAGLTRLGKREVARDAARVQALVGSIVSIRLVLAGAAFLLLLLAAWLLPGPAVVKLVTVLYGLSLFGMAIDLGWVFLGTEFMRMIALTEIAEQAAVAVGVILAVHNADDIFRVPLVYLIATTLGTGLLFIAYNRGFGRIRLAWGPGPDWRSLLREALPLAMSAGMGLINFNADSVLVGLMIGAHAAGLYGAAYRIVWAPAVLAAAYYTALLPSLDRAYREGLNSVAGLLDKSIRLTTAIGLGFGVGGTLLAKPGFEFVYGPDFNGSVVPFQILIWSLALLFVNRNFRNLLTAFNQQQAEARIIGTAAVTNVALTVILLPQWGLVGAAWASVSSETIILVFGYLYTRKLVGHVPLGRHIPRILLAAGGMGAVLVATEPLHLLVRVVAAGVVYAVALLGLRVISLSEVRLIFEVAGPTPPKSISAEG